MAPFSAPRKYVFTFSVSFISYHPSIFFYFHSSNSRDIVRDNERIHDGPLGSWRRGKLCRIVQVSVLLDLFMSLVLCAFLLCLWGRKAEIASISTSGLFGACLLGRKVAFTILQYELRAVLLERLLSLRSQVIVQGNFLL
jgi:hypothetical protein